MESVEESEEQSILNAPLEKNAQFEEDSSSEDTINGDPAEELVVNQFDIDIQMAIDKEADDKNGEDSDEFSDDEESIYQEMDESEIDSMLEQGFNRSKISESGQEVEDERSALPEERITHGNDLIIKKIVVLEEKDGNTFEVLPTGWIQVRHSSGIPVYLHRKTRVCTLSKPYYLGSGSVRRHSMPLSAIPCLSYRRALEKEKKDKEMLEEQAKELELQKHNQTLELETSQTQSTFLKHLLRNEVKTDPKVPNTCPDTIAEKVKLFKRKLGLEEENVGNLKREKIQDDFLENELDTLELPDLEIENVDPITSSEIPKVKENDGLQLKSISDDSSSEDAKPLIDSMDGESSLSVSNVEIVLESTSIPNDYRRDLKYRHKHPDVRALIPLAKVETARENANLYTVAPLDLREYCKSLFKFTEVECKRFKTWSARRRHTKEQKRRQLERPTLPDNAQVIKFFDLNASKGGDDQMVKKFNDYVFNPNGKSSVCILHEFVQHALRKQPTYAFQELENAATPYSATVMINEVPYGRGYGSSKKTAKAEAAKATLEILIPQMKGQLNGNKADTNSDFDITEYFQQVEMNDVRIPKMCTSVSEPSPYSLLLTCLQRNFGQVGSSGVKFEMIPCSPSKGNPPNQFRMTAGNDEVIVTASNKREGKQLASQSLLSKIHPHITNFGAFIKLYGNGSIKSVKEKKQEEQQITTLQSKASANSPNWAILNKLRQEMLKLSDQEQDLKGENGSTDSETISNSLNGSLMSSSESDTNLQEASIM